MDVHILGQKGAPEFMRFAYLYRKKMVDIFIYRMNNSTGFKSLYWMDKLFTKINRSLLLLDNIGMLIFKDGDMDVFRVSLFKVIELYFSKLVVSDQVENTEDLEKCVREWMCEQLDGICDESIMVVVKQGGEAIHAIREVM